MLLDKQGQDGGIGHGFSSWSAKLVEATAQTYPSANSGKALTMDLPCFDGFLGRSACLYRFSIRIGIVYFADPQAGEAHGARLGRNRTRMLKMDRPHSRRRSLRHRMVGG